MQVRKQVEIIGMLWIRIELECIYRAMLVGEVTMF